MSRSSTKSKRLVTEAPATLTGKALTASGSLRPLPLAPPTRYPRWRTRLYVDRSVPYTFLDMLINKYNVEVRRTVVLDQRVMEGVSRG